MMTPQSTNTQLSLNLSATFTAEPLEPTLAYWSQRLGLETSVHFAPYNQVFQSLLDPSSPFHRSTPGLNILLVRPEDWQRFGSIGSPEWETELTKNTDEFITALQAKASAAPSGFLVILTAPSAKVQASPELNQLMAALANKIASACQELRIPVVTNQTISSFYPVDEALDTVADREGHIPYTDAYFAALGTIIARRLHASLVPPPKVIVVDGDNTLWPGVAAETGPKNLQIAPPFQAFQRFLKARLEAGTLLCIASKNEEQDVRDVFAHAEGMILQAENIVGWKVNWSRKSNNIAALADELNLGLDSFVFIDDNPMEIAEVASQLPQVTTVQIPEDPEELASFFNHHWLLDLPTAITQEDSNRTAMYQTMVARSQSRAAASDFQTFLRELNLQVSCAPVTADSLPRVAQLTQRTNQFNTTTLRRSEQELNSLLESEHAISTVSVTDRFGDYGLVGVIISQIRGTHLFIDNLLLSCRVLGKGVEQKILAQLAKEARDKGATHLEFPFQANERNTPVRLFLEGIGSSFLQPSSGHYLFPLSIVEEAANKAASEQPASPSQTSKHESKNLLTSLEYQEIAQLSSITRIKGALQTQRRPRPDLSEPYAAPNTEIERTLAQLWQETLHVDRIGRNDRFAELGGKSLQVIQLLAKLTRTFDTPVTAPELFQKSTIAAQAEIFAPKGEQSARKQTNQNNQNSNRDIAVIGMSCRLPESPDVHQFWQNLLDSKECLTHLTDADLLSAGVDPSQVRNDSGYIPVKGLMENVENFDAKFFGILPNEAKLMDPQHRVFLELAWDCLEDAGYNSEEYEGKIGVWAGNYLDTYALSNLVTDREFLKEWIPAIQVGSLQAELGNDKDYLATRVAFKLNLRGPAMTVQSACSTSLVAISQAVQSIRAGSCDMALAGGITITLPEKKGYYFTPDGILSQDGSCRAFDEKASGTVFSNGAGIVLLKGLEEALRDGDHIHAVIKGVALNNDGGRKHSYTAPSIDGQASVVTEAIQDAAVDPSTISYVEAHGTGTPLGDPIEVAGLTKAYRELGVTHNQGCTIGTVKPNVGHLDVASGVTALIKTSFALEHAKLPATLHFQKANPKIDFENSPFQVRATLTDWETGEAPRRAGISSFGVGGTNAHIVLEQPPVQESSPSSRPFHLFPLSARSDESLARTRERLSSYCSRHNSLNAADISHTLRIGRKHFAKRQVLVSDSLTNLEQARAVKASPKEIDAPLVFMFPGQGSQTVGMGRDLYRSEPYFRAELDRCSAILRPHLGEDLRDTLFPPADADQEAAALRIKQTIMAQPAIFVLSYCQARLLMHWGLTPTALVGHSVGELVAATLSGIVTLEDALEILAHRGRLMQSIEPGGMLSVRLSEDKLIPLIPAHLDLAAVNGPELCVVAGPHDELEKFTQLLSEQDIAAKSLHTSHGFHSWMMDPVIAPFQEVIAQAKLSPPQIPIRSTVTTEWLSDEEATDPAYWAAHVRHTVRFTQTASYFCERPETTLLEIGPGQTLSTLSRQVADKKAKQAIFSTSGHATDPDSDALHFQLALGQLWLHGHTIDWDSYKEGETRKRVPLPTYPFERKRFWIDPTPLTDAIPAPVNLSQPSPPPNVSPPQPAPTMPTDRKPVILDELCQVLNDLSGIEPEEMEADASLIELGFDSLMLTQVSKEIGKSFGVETTMRQLLASLPTLGDIVSYLDAEMPADQFQASQPEQPVAPQQAPQQTTQPQVGLPQSPQQPLTAPALPQPFPVPAGDQNALVLQMLNVQMQQMQFMQQQMQLLSGLPATALPNPQPAPQIPVSAPIPAPAAPTPTQPATPKSGTASGTTTTITRDSDPDLTEQQRKHLDSLIASYVARTQSSKEWTARYRRYHADPRTVAGFNRNWKEMIYQLVVERSKGSRLLDIDGNEYIDILNGFGPGFFGHSPDFVLEAVRAQLDSGYEVGPQTPLVGETAKLFCELTGNDRASFVCTGSEAVQAAMRLARTATGRDKIAVFTKDYHGNFDEVLLRGSQAKRKPRTFPSAPGVPKSAVSNMLVLDYGTDESLEILKEHAHELAAIMIEPVQSRRPEFQPHEFIKELRTLTEEAGALLIFDEVICGLRDGPHGAQGFYGVKSDISTYGKVIGGGLPIGIVAGKAQYMDTFDGGTWQYGDDSFPEAGVTFFAGTFVRHPLGIAAAHAVLKHLKKQGPALWATLNARASRLYTTVDQFMVDNDIPIRLPGLHSRFFVRVAEDCKYGNLLFFHLRKKGVFILEGFPSYITTAHTDEDIDYVINAFKESVAELQEGGFFPKTEAINLLNGGRLTGPAPLLATSQGAPSPSIPAASESSAAPQQTEDLPLTEAQREIWLACQLGQEASCAFNEATSLVFDGSLNVQALTRALNTAVAHHDALRSSFDAEGDTWNAEPEIDIRIPFQDISQKSDTDKLTAIQLATETQAFTPFDLTQAPLIRANLLKVGTSRHILFLTAHHLVADGWSFNVLIETLSDCYNAFNQDLPNPLLPAASFANYALARHEKEQSNDPDPHLDYWLSQYPDSVPVLNLPTDRPFPNERTFSGATLQETIDADLLKALRKAGAKSGATLYATTLSAFQLLLQKLSGQNDLVIGIPAAGQSSQGLENLVGHCVNFLPLRARVDASQPFSELVQTVAARVLEAYEHQDCTYGQLVPRLKIQRLPGRMPLTEVGFNLERMDYFKPFDGLETEFVDSPKSFVNQLLFLNLVESKNGLSIEAHYNTTVLEHSTVESWIQQYREILESIAKNPEDTSSPTLTNLAQTPLSQEEPLPLSADNTTDYPRNATVQEVFEEVAAAHPNRIALQLRDWTVDYHTLNQLANRVAMKLRENGVSANQPIPVLLDRSFDFVISILATLKAGGGYVPIDPCYPAERIAALLAPLDSPVILTRSNFAEELSLDFGGKIISVDEIVKGEEGPQVPNPAPSSKPTDLAYVMFTSGSTGTSKGVEIPHRGIVRLVKNTNYADLSADQVYLQASSLSFDASTFEIWAPLLNGGRLVLLPPGPPSLETIAQEIKERQVTTLWLTAGLFHLLVDERIDALAPLQQLLAGGDVLSKSHVTQVLAKYPNLKVINGYGPTENTTFTCCHSITPPDLNNSTIPIGRPISNTEVYLLDGEMTPVPPHTEGELYFGGDGLALGYFKNAALTAERFVANPFSPKDNAKLYRSGDRASYRTDGTIEFLGRTDNEVKIRGFRIDPVEIEEALCRHEAVKQARVLAQGNKAEDKVLVAYAATDSAKEDELKSFLQSFLPSHLLPSRVITVESLPVTENGKIDDHALPAVSEVPTIDREEPRAPESETEKQMAKLWSKVLNLPDVPANRSFFDLGGHSLQALKLFNQIDKEFGVKLPLSTLFENPTVAALAARFAPNEPVDPKPSQPAPLTEQPPNLAALTKGGSLTPFFCIHGGDGGTLIYRGLASSLPHDRPIYALEAPALSGDAKVIPSIRETAALYLAQIRTVQAEGPYLLGGYCFGGVVAYEMAQQLKNAGEQVDLLCLFDTDNPAVAPRYLSLTERAARNWNEDASQSWAGRVGKLGGRLSEGIMNKLKTKTEKAAASVAASTGMEVNSKLHTVMIRESHDQAMQNYTPGDYTGDVVLFTAEDQGDGVEYPPHLGWEGSVKGNLQVITIPGEHLTIFQEPHVRDFADKLNAILAPHS